MKLLVTGANGFVGRAVCRHAKSHTMAVRAAVRRKESRPDDIESVIVGNIDGNTDWQAALAGCDAVLHLAARVHVMADQAVDALAEYRRVNVDGTLHLANQSAKAGIKRFVFVSSVKVNGESTQPGKSFTADDVPDPQDPYGISKCEAEVGLRALATKTGMEVVIVRPPLVYGPDVKANFAMMLRWLERGTPLPLGAVTENRRSFVSVLNLSDFLLTCVRHPGAANQTFLVSDDNDMSTATLLRQQAALIGKRARLFYVPVSLLRIGSTLLGKQNIYQRLCGSLQVDIQKNKELLGWAPITAIKDRKSRHVTRQLDLENVD